MILVFGQSGQVARELAAILPDARFVSRAELDLAAADAPARIAALVAEARPAAVINAAAYTAVDRAESEEDIARAVNGDAPAAMARAAAALGVAFVHISTDYVFDGAGDQPFAPDAATGPLGAYGRSKLAGEAGVQAAGGAYAILRTSWVFSAHGSNFVRTMLRLSETRDRLSVVADQIGGPTPAAAIARACVAIAKALTAAPEKAGIYHFSGAPDTSWAGFARAIFAAAGRDVTVADIPSSDYPTPARRPANSRLDCGSLTRVFGIERPDWLAELHGIIKALEASDAA